jgi:ankyrin repeat protein
MNRQEAIVAAVKAKDAAQVEALLQEDTTLIQTKTHDGSLVLTAVYRGAREVVEVLLRHNPPLDIFEAATVGSAERIATLLAADPALVHAANATGFEPLHLAAFFGHADAARALLAGGADVNRIMRSQVPYVPSNTALHAAVAGGPHRELVELLVAAGADVNRLDSNGHTPLHAAAFHNDAEVVAFLVAHGADVHRHGEGAPTPLAYALEHGKEVGAAALRATGAVE